MYIEVKTFFKEGNVMVRKYSYIDVNQECYSLENRDVCIWGRSISALELYVKLHDKGVNVIGFTDSYADKGEVFAGLPVFDFSEIQEMDSIVIYISTVNMQFAREILELTEHLNNAIVLCKGVVYGAGCYNILNLEKLIKKDTRKIEAVRNALCDKKSVDTFDNLLKYRISNEIDLINEIYETDHCQYFPDEQILPKYPNEIFIDAGGYNGATSCEFAEWIEDDYLKIYVMEPDDLMFAIAEEYVKIKGLRDVTLINKGAYSCEKRLAFHNDADSGSSCISTNGSSCIQTISIDEMLAGGKATFIKMDIEGAEMEALIGAEQTITMYRPKLAISVYHNEDDLWKIPYYLKEKYPWYKLYLRHYTRITTETVLYAVADEEKS